MLASITPTLFLVNGDLARMYTFALLVASFGGVLAGVAAPCVKAATLNVNDPESRGVACAIQVRQGARGTACAVPKLGGEEGGQRARKNRTPWRGTRAAGKAEEGVTPPYGACGVPRF